MDTLGNLRHGAQIDAGDGHQIERRAVMLGNVKAIKFRVVRRGDEFEALLEQLVQRQIIAVHMIPKSEFHFVPPPLMRFL